MTGEATTGPADPMGAAEYLRDVAEALVPGVWPSADVAELRRIATSCRELADALLTVANDVVQAHRPVLDGDGRFPAAVTAAADRIAGDRRGGLADTAWQVGILARRLDAYAGATVAARSEMTLIAAVADRDRLAADVAAALGDDSARVLAASAGRMSLTAAADEYAADSGTAAANGWSAALAADGDPESTSGHGADSPSAAAAGGAPMGGMGAMAGLGAVAGARAGHVASGAQTQSLPRDPLRDTEVSWLGRRAEQVQASVPPAVSAWVRTCVGLGALDGRRVVVIGTSDPQPYVRPGMDVRADEQIVGDGGVPELTVMAALTDLGAEPLAVATVGAVASSARSALAAADVEFIER